MCKVIKTILKYLIIVIGILLLSFLIAILLIEPIITNGVWGWKPFTTEFTTSEWFAFSASYIGAIGSIFVGVITLLQSKKYKEQSDEYANKMDNLLILSEIYPISIQKVNDHTASNYAYFKIDGIEDKIGEGQNYRVIFTVIKNPVINFKLISFKADYYIKDKIYARYDRAENANKVSCDLSNLTSYNPVDTCFTIGLCLPKINANYQPNGVIPDIIKVDLKLEYENQYGMICQKEIQLDLNEEWSRQTTDRGAYPTWHIKQAKIFQGGKQ